MALSLSQAFQQLQAAQASITGGPSKNQSSSQWQAQQAQAQKNLAAAQQTYDNTLASTPAVERISFLKGILANPTGGLNSYQARHPESASSQAARKQLIADLTPKLNAAIDQYTGGKYQYDPTKSAQQNVDAAANYAQKLEQLNGATGGALKGELGQAVNQFQSVSQQTGATNPYATQATKISTLFANEAKDSGFTSFLNTAVPLGLAAMTGGALASAGGLLGGGAAAGGGAGAAGGAGGVAGAAGGMGAMTDAAIGAGLQGSAGITNMALGMGGAGAGTAGAGVGMGLGTAGGLSGIMGSGGVSAAEAAMGGVGATGAAGGGGIMSTLGQAGQSLFSNIGQNLMTSAGQQAIGGLLGSITGILGPSPGQQATGAQNMVDPFAPYRTMYAQQLNQLMQNPASVQQLPGYQAQMQQGTQAVQRALAAKGGAASGQELMGLQDYASAQQNQYFQQQLQNLAMLSGANTSPTQGGLTGVGVGRAGAAQQMQNLGGIASGIGSLITPTQQPPSVQQQYAAPGIAGGGGQMPTSYNTSVDPFAGTGYALA